MTRDVYKDCMNLINEIGGISEVMLTKHPDLVHDHDSIDECLNSLHDLLFEELEN